MKKHSVYRKVSSILLATAVLCAVLLSGCQKAKNPSAENARNYVMALLDLTCAGNLEKAVETYGVEERQAKEMQQEVLDGLYPSLKESAELDENTRALLRDYLIEAGKYCHYTVLPVDGPVDENSAGYDLQVMLEPCKIFKGISSILDEEIAAMRKDNAALAGASQDEIRAKIFSAVFQRLTENLKNAEYGQPETVTVHYGPVDQAGNVYGLNDEDCRALGDKLFSMEGLE